MRNTILILLMLIAVQVQSQENPTRENSLSFLFIGDIMGHDTQIASAFDESTGSYDYASCLEYLTPVIEGVDFAVANLEVTLAGPPFKGYPQFSSPDQLAIDFKKCGIDIFATANNHSCDRRKQGIIRTLDVLDSISMMHTGTYRDNEERAKTNPLIIEKNNIKVALLNYTYGTNGIPVPSPTVVNLIDKSVIEDDIRIARTKSVDKVIIFFHWGLEYQSEPNDIQIDLAGFCLSKGADIIIGSHPHVIQKAIWQNKVNADSDTLIAYSLGNFISNQRKPRTDGGMLFQFTIEKSGNETRVTDAAYHLTWVNKSWKSGKTKFHVLPCAVFENKSDFFDSSKDFEQMQSFISESRKLMKSQNINIKEYQ